MTRLLFHSSIIESVSADWYEKMAMDNTTNDTVKNTNTKSHEYGMKLLPGKLESSVMYAIPQNRGRDREQCV